MPLGLGTLALLSLGISGGGSAIGAIGSAINNSNARKESNRRYQQAKDYLTSEYYRDPLSTVGNRSLIKAAKQQHKDELEAINNRMIAGGATMENQLAARQASNEGMDRLYGSLLQSEDARKRGVSQQQLQNELNYSMEQQRNYQQNAQNWQAWGAQIANAGGSLLNASMLEKK